MLSSNSHAKPLSPPDGRREGKGSKIHTGRKMGSRVRCEEYSEFNNVSLEAGMWLV